MEDRILVFVPCYNCAPQIGRVLAQLDGPITDFVDALLVLDNGSSDGTIDAAIANGPSAHVRHVTIGRNRANYNLGGSHKAAYAYAMQKGYSHVVTLHGDDQGDINDLLPVLERGDHNRYDACMGARFADGSRITGYSAFRIVGNHVFNLFFSAAARRRITDMGSGLNLLAHAAFSAPEVRRLPDDLYFNPYLLLDMIDRGNRVHFFPISWREDDQVSNVKMMSQALQTLGAAWRYTVNRRAFRSNDYRTIRRDEYGFDVVATFKDRIRT